MVTMPPRLNDSIRRRVIDLYQQGWSASDIAKTLGRDRDTLLKVLKEAGIEIRRGKKPRLFTAKEEQEIAQMYRQGMTGHAIAQAKSCGPTVIYATLKRQGVTFRPGAMGNGEDNVAWKGGRTINAEGYAYRYIPDGHPLVNMRSMNRYAREHRVVMAEHLGRPLRVDEEVHHKNGNRQDNGIENLQLRVKNHGSGVKLCCGECGSQNLVSLEL